MSGSTSQELRAREERAGPKATIITPRGPAPAPAPGETPTVVEPAEVEPGEDPKVSEGPRPSIVQGTLLAGRYRIERHLGSGGMGDVFLAEHVDLRRSVAIKILGAEYTRRPELVRRFLTEARAASMIRHDHVVDITDFGYTAERVPFFVMEWLDGEDLSATIRREAPIHWQRARAIIIQLLVALEAAHEHGVIHRDIKPGNCFRVNLRGNPDYIKVLDFGIAKVRSGAESDPGVKTGTGVVMGTTDYMSPEQAQGLPLDHRTDLYSVGIILFQLITNRLPFTADTLLAALVKRLAEEPPSPRAKAPSADISPELERVVLKSLARSRDDRYANARAFIEALEGIGALPTPAIKPRSSRGLVATAGGLIAALIGVWTWYNMVGVAADPDRA
ncbi:MAG: serine/threonine protein kinase, partial [Myxococcales bacterium]|nr:serine/threonine protein kinase [Myxococcales bacterium]